MYPMLLLSRLAEKIPLLKAVCALDKVQHNRPTIDNASVLALVGISGLYIFLELLAGYDAVLGLFVFLDSLE